MICTDRDHVCLIGSTLTLNLNQMNGKYSYRPGEKKQKISKLVLQNSKYFMANYSWTWDLLWSVTDIASDIHWRKFDSSSQQVSIAHIFFLKVGTCGHSPYPCLVICLFWTHTCLVHAVKVSEFICSSALLENTISLELSTMPESYNFSTSWSI